MNTIHKLTFRSLLMNKSRTAKDGRFPVAKGEAIQK